MKRTHLIAIAVGALLLSSSTIGLAQAGSHKEAKSSHSKEEKGKAIKLKNRSEIHFFDTSTVIPHPHFDTSTVTSPVDIEEEDGNMPRFDTSTVISHGDDSGDLSEQSEQNGQQGDHGKHGNQGDHGKHGNQGDHKDSFSGTLPASPPGTSND